MENKDDKKSMYEKEKNGEINKKHKSINICIRYTQRSYRRIQQEEKSQQMQLYGKKEDKELEMIGCHKTETYKYQGKWLNNRGSVITHFKKHKQLSQNWQREQVIQKIYYL
ncbi:unnamed protein product [Paramecium sonneborni]|uniref:Uncharacterized protein n=1 Tax=Paramecium sonneborni TaxID=65129 RepID=A0A8S1R6K6_9CILI|nr:unnamed protein product [Paramecium sonneborni]